ncbi:MAG: epoxide hydrolase family protein [Candidatus Saccharimonadales bacterium]
MAVKPYKIAIKQSDIDGLKDRLKNARWPHDIKDSDWDRGVPHAYLKKLADYWLHEFDWRKAEAALNKYDQFMAEIDGQNIHFFHVKSKEAGALPLMLLHGWPSSNIEFLKLIDILTNPVAHGGKAEDAFHVVIPTTPGFGLSGPMTEHWDAQRTASAYSKLMKELGYEKWGLHGSDVGTDIAGEVNHIDKNLTGVHLATDMPSIIWYANFTGNDPTKNPKFSKADKELIGALAAKGAEDGGYLEIQKTRPLTIGYLLNDSPLGQLAWIAEKFKFWTDKGSKLPEDTVDLDQMLTNISLYWFTGSGASAADFLCTNLHAQRDWSRPSLAPMGMAVFGAEGPARAMQDPEKQMPYWSEFKQGGHFPAMEVPKLLAGDLRKFFSEYRA